MKRSIGKTLIKAAVAVAAVNAAVCTIVSHKKKKAAEKEIHNTDNEEKHFEVFMQGRQITLGEGEFKRVKVKTFMGGVDLDLRAAVITEDISIKCKSFMGGINIRVPEGVNVVVKGKSVLGGITNFVPVKQGDDIPTVYIESEQIMGGLCINCGSPDLEESEEDTECAVCEEVVNEDPENKDPVNDGQ